MLAPSLYLHCILFFVGLDTSFPHILQHTSRNLAMSDDEVTLDPLGLLVLDCIL